MPKPPAANDKPSMLDALLSHWSPSSVLSVGPKAAQLLTPYTLANRTVSVTRLACDGAIESALEALSSEGRFDFALVAGLEHADSSCGATLVSRLRDVHAKRLCVYLGRLAAGGVWSREELVALGLQPLVQSEGAHIFGFDISGYKDTPDWLNAKNWANPELWGKHRW